MNSNIYSKMLKDENSEGREFEIGDPESKGERPDDLPTPSGKIVQIAQLEPSTGKAQ